MSLHLEKCLNWSNTCELNIQGSQTVVGLATAAGFNSSHLYAQHARSVHSIPVFGAEFQPTQPPDQSAINGSLQSYSIQPTDDEMVLARDLKAFMKFKQERIQEIIDQKL